MKFEVVVRYITCLLFICLCHSVHTRNTRDFQHEIYRRAAGDNSTNTESSSSGCTKTCTLAVVASVLAVFIICLVGSIYYATHQDKGQRKNQQEWARSIKTIEKRYPTHQPINLHQLDERLNKLGRPRSIGAPDMASMFGSENYAYENESYYNDSVHQEKVQNLYNEMGWDNQDNQDLYEIRGNRTNPRFNNPQFNQYSQNTTNLPRRNRMLSAPEMYHQDDIHSLGPRAFSLDNNHQSMFPNNDPDYGYDYDPDNGYPDIGYPYQDGDGVFDDGNYFGPDAFNTGHRYQQQPKSEPMQRRRLPQTKRPLKSALKHSKSFQEMPPIEQQLERFHSDDVADKMTGNFRAKFNRSHSLDELNQQNNQSNYALDEDNQSQYVLHENNQSMNFHMAYDEENNQHQYVIGRNADSAPVIDTRNNTTYNNNDSYPDRDINVFNGRDDNLNNVPTRELQVLDERDYGTSNIPTRDIKIIDARDEDSHDYRVPEIHVLDEYELDKNHFHRSNDLLERVYEKKIRQNVIE